MKFWKLVFVTVSSIIGLNAAQAQSPFQQGDFVFIPSLGVEIQKHEVTYRQWMALDAQMPADRQSPWLKTKYCIDADKIKNTSDNYPVACIAKFDAQVFIHKLNVIDPQYNYRLPEDSEQLTLLKLALEEFKSKFPDPVDKYRILDYAWLKENSNDRAHEVCTRMPLLGLCDLLGNMTEWNQTTYNGGSGDAISRGGTWQVTVFYAFQLADLGFPPMLPNDSRAQDNGFRLVRTPK